MPFESHIFIAVFFQIWEYKFWWAWVEDTPSHHFPSTQPNNAKLSFSFHSFHPPLFPPNQTDHKWNKKLLTSSLKLKAKFIEWYNLDVQTAF